MNSNTLYIFAVVMLFVSMIVQANVQRKFTKYSQVAASSGLTGFEAARRILDENGLKHVAIERTHGTLSDHYDPSSQTLRLSEGVADSISIAAVSVAAHEAGHAVQHASNYAPLALRTASVYAAQFGSHLSWPIFLLGMILSFQPLLYVGIALYVVIVFFTLVTLPVEFNASSRALAMLVDNGTITELERPAARGMLSSAAMTYVVAAISAIIQLLRLLAIANNSRRRD